jgi:hypothetical protein
MSRADPSRDIASDPTQPSRLEKNANIASLTPENSFSDHFPNIFATMKIRTAPPKPPPSNKYSSEYPAAARIREEAKMSMGVSLGSKSYCDSPISKFVRA